MFNEDILIFILILTVGVAIRLPFSSAPSSDSWVVLNHLERLKNKKWLDYSVYNSIFSAKDGYPILLHFFISRFNRKNWKIIGILLNTFFDISVAIILYIILKSDYLLPLPTIAGIDGSLVTILLFLTMPIFFPFTSRLKTINARTAGFPFVIIYMFLLFYLVNVSTSDASAIFLVLILTFLFIMNIALSMFAVQVILFFSIILAMFYMNIIILLPIVFGFLVALIPSLNLGPALGHHMHFKIWYWFNYKKNLTASKRNTLLELKKVIKAKKIIRWNRYLTNINTITAAIIALPELVIIGYLIMQDYSNFLIYIKSNLLLQFSWFIVLASLIIFTIVSIPRFSFLGQAERYFEYSAPFLILLIVSYPPYQTGKFILILLMVHIIAIAFLSFILYGKGLFGDFAKFNINMIDIANWFNENVPNAKVLSNPVKNTYLISAMQYKNILSKDLKLYFRYVLKEDDVGYKYFEKDITSPFGDSREALVNRNPFEMAREYGLTHLVLEKRFLKQFNENSIYIQLSKSKEYIEYENQEFLIVSLLKKEYNE